MDTQLWAIAIKAGSRKGDVADKKAALKKATEGTAAMVEEFELPIAELRVGTMDSLMSLGDDLNKMDMLADATTTKLFKQLDEIGKEMDKEAGLPVKDIPAEVSGISIGQYVKTWSWDEAKFQLKTPLRELAENISMRINGLDDELKSKAGELNSLKTTITNIDRKTQGNLMVRGLDDIVDEDDDLESEYMTTVYVCVPKGSMKDFEASYMKMAEYVVPLSGKCLKEDPEFGLYRVIVFKKCADAFKSAAKDKKYTVREFVYDEARKEMGEKEKEDKTKEYKGKLSLLKTWCNLNFSECYSMSLHIKAIRVFVESVMRFGLTEPNPTSYSSQKGPRRPNFTAFLLQPSKGKAEVLRKDLAKLYATSGKFQDGDDDNIVVPGGISDEFYPYVYVPITLDFLSA